MDKELAANNENDITSEASSGANDDNLDYVESRKKLPAISDKSP